MSVDKPNYSNQSAWKSWNTSAFGEIPDNWSEVPNPLQGTFLETPAPLYACLYNTDKCVVSVSRYLTYDLPKNIVETTWSTVQWLGSKALSQGDSFLKKGFNLVGNNNPPLLQKSVTDVCHDIKQQGNKVIQAATEWATGSKTQEQLLASNVSPSLAEPFSIIELLGPAILMGYATNKAIGNAKSTLFHLYLLLSGKRTVTTTYKTTPKNWTMSAGKECRLIHTKPYSACKLTRDIVMEGSFAALFSGIAYFSFQGIKEALINGGCEESRAQMLTQYLMVAQATAPVLYAFAKACLENDDRLEGPESSPHLAYSNSSDHVSIDQETPQEKPFRENPDHSSSPNNNPLGLLTNSESRGLFN